MTQIKIKIRTKYYTGKILSKISDDIYKCKYKIGNHETTGFFKRSEFEIVEEEKQADNTLIKRQHYKIKCQCGYYCVVPRSENGFGKCPECMKENFEILEDRGEY